MAQEKHPRANFLLTKKHENIYTYYDLFIPKLNMSPTIKTAISMPASIFKELELMRRKAGLTRSQFIRDAIRAWKDESQQLAAVKEEPVSYGLQPPAIFADHEELRLRAIKAAGRFRSGLTDLSENHDRYLEEAFSAIQPPKKILKR